MESVFNINPSNLPELRNINPYNYTFLDGILDINSSRYYNLIQSLEDYKIKNLYNFLYLRSLKMYQKKNTRKLELNKYIQSSKILDESFNKYFNNEKLYAILIMNGIQLYFFPTMTQ